MSSPTDPPPDPSERPPSVPGPREEPDGWAAPAGPTGPTGPGAGNVPGYGDPYGAPPPGPAAGPDPYGSGGPFGPGSAAWAPKPGIVPLRPLGLGEILDGAVSYVRAHPRAVLGTSAIVAVIAHLVGVPLSRLIGGDAPVPGPTPNPSPAAVADLATASLAAQAPLSIMVGLATVVLTGLLVVVVSRSVLGAPVDGGEAWRAVRPRIPGLVGVTVLSGLLAALAFVVGILPGALLLFAGLAIPGGIVIVLGGIVGVLAVVALYTALSLAPPVYVLEGGGVLEALRRSWVLVKPRFWPVLGITLLASVIAGVVNGILVALLGGVALGVIALVGAQGALSGVLSALLGAVGGIVGMAVVTPFQAGVTGLLYVDQRMRREGFDIELQRAASFGSW